MITVKNNKPYKTTDDVELSKQEVLALKSIYQKQIDDCTAKLAEVQSVIDTLGY